MGSEQRAVCPENEALVEHMRKWWAEMAENKPKNYTQNTEKTLQKAFSNVCHHKSPITTLKELKDVKGVGKWIVTEMRDFFNCDSGPSQDDDLAKKGKKTKGSKNYLPQKNSVAYALLITLHRETGNGTEYMRKNDLIDAAEASGLARVPIAPERGRGKPGAPGSSPREFYSGWSAMTKLIKESLVYKSSCPAKYMLSDKGRQVALECLSRSGMLDSAPNLVSSEETPDEQDDEVLELASAKSPIHSNLNINKGTKDDIPAEFLERFTLLGYTREQVVHALAEVSRCWSPKELSTLWPKVLCRLREIEVYDSHSDPQASLRRNSGDASTSCRYVEGQQTLTSGRNQNSYTLFRSDASLVATESPIIASSSFDYHAKKGHKFDPQASHDALRLPPLENLEKFENVYEVVLMLDDRENFVRTKTRNLREKICAEFNIQIEVDHLPVGDAIWIARHKQRGINYVLDYIVERKNVDDLRGSIRDNRYKDQKLRLQRTGIKKIMYVVEGDPNSIEGADSIKTACFTTELLDGFDVQRTSNLSDTLRRYGYLTQAITDYYKLNSCPEKYKTAGTCLSYDEFIKKCKDLHKMTVSDVFAMQLMQVPQVTEEVAIAVLNCYPTLYSLACAYATLGEDTVAQEELLKTKSEGAVNAVASKNIFRFVWVS